MYFLNDLLGIPIAQAGVISDAPSLASGFAKILNFLLSIVGVLGIIGLILAGALYFFAAGNEKQMRLAKGAMIASVTGIIIALGAYVIISQISAFFQ